MNLFKFISTNKVLIDKAIIKELLEIFKSYQSMNKDY